MSALRAISYLSVEEYLAGEMDGPVRHEYVAGQIYAMAGASDRHNRIAGNIYSRLNEHLADASCEPFMSDMKVRVGDLLFYYPDVLVACDAPGADPYYRKKPVLIVEVLSPGTQRTDRTEKLSAYKQVKSLKEYVLVAQDRMCIEVHRRGRGGRWQQEILTEPEQELRLESVGLKLRVAEVYRRVKFPQ